MSHIRKRQHAGWAAVLVASLSLAPLTVKATIVEFQTVMGTIEVNLYDNTTPATVANFLNYVNNGAYTNAIFHRSVSGFVVQGGGFAFDTSTPIVDIPANAAVVNEPQLSNVRGTIAMAKLGGQPNSATNQWFFNLNNNAGTLDGQNGGFTVFGEVIGNGMDIVDAMAALPTFPFAAPFGEMPLQNFTNTDLANGVALDATNLMLISEIIVSDSTVDSAAGLSPVPNTSNTGGGGGAAPVAPASGGGGSLGLLTLFALLLAHGRKRVVSRRF